MRSLVCPICEEEIVSWALPGSRPLPTIMKDELVDAIRSIAIAGHQCPQVCDKCNLAPAVRQRLLKEGAMYDLCEECAAHWDKHGLGAKVAGPGHVVDVPVSASEPNPPKAGR